MKNLIEILIALDLMIKEKLALDKQFPGLYSRYPKSLPVRIVCKVGDSLTSQVVGGLIIVAGSSPGWRMGELITP